MGFVANASRIFSARNDVTGVFLKEDGRVNALHAYPHRGDGLSLLFRRRGSAIASTHRGNGRPDARGITGYGPPSFFSYRRLSRAERDQVVGHSLFWKKRNSRGIFQPDASNIASIVPTWQLGLDAIGFSAVSVPQTIRLPEDGRRIERRMRIPLTSCSVDHSGGAESGPVVVSTHGWTV